MNIARVKIMNEDATLLALKGWIPCTFPGYPFMLKKNGSPHFIIFKFQTAPDNSFTLHETTPHQYN